MGVIRARAARSGQALLSGVLAAGALILKVALMATSTLAGLLETWAQHVQARHATASLAAARNARTSDRWRAAFEAAPLGMAKVSPEGRLTDVNSALCVLLGEPERAVVGRRLSAFIYPDDLGALTAGGGPGGPRGGASRAEVRLLCSGGRLRWCEIATSLVRDGEGRAEYVLTSVVDITRHKRSQAALRDLATRDPLSGLANRRWFEVQLVQHLRLCADEGPRGALLVMDLDNFKSVNDTLGHQAGDRLVIEVAVTLRRHLRDRDVVARLGGDEFAVVVRDGDRWAAEAVARKLVLAVRDEVFAGTISSEAPAAGVTVSVGVAPFELFGCTGNDQGVATTREVVKAADAAMYAVKRSGRNGYAVAGTGDAPRHARHRSGVEAEAPSPAVPASSQTAGARAGAPR